MANRNGREDLKLAGLALQQIRNHLRLTLRDVHAASLTVAQKKKNRRFMVSATTLHDILTNNRMPSIHCLYTLAAVYRRPLHDILLLYRIY